MVREVHSHSRTHLHAVLTYPPHQRHWLLPRVATTPRRMTDGATTRGREFTSRMEEGSLEAGGGGGGGEDRRWEVPLDDVGWPVG